MQIAQPSRGAVKECRQIRHELERTAGHINGKYAAPHWVPIHYINKSFPQALPSSWPSEVPRKNDITHWRTSFLSALRGN